MKTDDIIQSIKSKKFDDKVLIPSEINAHEIINISDMIVLKEIAKHINKFEVLQKTETWPKDSSRQYVLGSMDKLNTFLNDIAEAACRCTLCQTVYICHAHEVRFGIGYYWMKKKHSG